MRLVIHLFHEIRNCCCTELKFTSYFKMDVWTLAVVPTSRYYLIAHIILIIHILFILPILLLINSIRQVIILIIILLLVHHLILMYIKSQIIQSTFLEPIFCFFFLLRILPGINIIHSIHQLIVSQIASIHIRLVHLHLSKIRCVHHIDIDHRRPTTFRRGTCVRYTCKIL